MSEISWNMARKTIDRDPVLAAAYLAEAAHDGQVDKTGDEYFRHLGAVARKVEDAYPGVEVIEVVAWLHDIVEDSPVTLNEIGDLFGPTVRDAVDAITHRAHERRDDYYARVMANPIAHRVKLADVEHNAAPERLARIADSGLRERLTAKYAHASLILRSTEDGQGSDA